jgi:hypothetical protein
MYFDRKGNPVYVSGIPVILTQPPETAIEEMSLEKARELADSLISFHRLTFGGFRMKDGEDDDDEDDKEGEDDGDDTSGDGDGDEDEDDDDKSKDDGDSDKDKDDKVSREEHEKLKARMVAADKAKAKAEAELRKIADSKKDDLTKATDRVTELETEVKEKDEQISGLRLENAFLSANTHKWHDNDTALEIARSKGLLDEVLNDDGEVEKGKLKSALDKLAKDHKYLVKSEDDDEPNPSGVPVGSKSKKADKEARKKELEGRFPILR